MAGTITFNYKGKELYLINETDDFYFVSKNKDGSKQFAIRKSEIL